MPGERERLLHTVEVCGAEPGLRDPRPPLSTGQQAAVARAFVSLDDGSVAKPLIWKGTMSLHPTRSRFAATLALAVAGLIATPVSALADTSPTGTSTTNTSPPTTSVSPTTATTTATTTGTTTKTTTAKTTRAKTTTTTPPAPPSHTLMAPRSVASTPATTTTPKPQLKAGGNASSYGIAAAAGPATSTDAAQVAAGYLVRQLATNGDHLNYPGATFLDGGLTIDTVLGLDAAGSGQAEATRATTFLAANIKSYIGAGGELYAGAIAKALNVAVAQHVNPRNFGGTSLVTTLQGMETPTGRFSDVSQYGDYSNALGQSFAVIGLHRAGADVSGKPVDYLLTLQCPNGSFRLDPTTVCGSETDATSFAVQALIAVRGTQDTAVQKGLDFLAGKQAADGGVGGGANTTAANANSTGLAGQAFLAGGRTAQARKATGYLESVQYGCSFPAPMRGGFAYDKATYAAKHKAGANATLGDQDTRATAQAILAVAGTPLYAVTATGADSTAPALACAPSPSPSSTTTATHPTTSGPVPASSSTTVNAPTGSTTSRTPAAAPVSTANSSGSAGLAFTGVNLVMPMVLALLLLLVGAIAIVATRTRGKHS